MKNPVFFFTLLCICLMAACHSSDTDNQPEIGKYIQNYTAGTIVSSSSIHLYLEKDPFSKFRKGDILPAKILKFTPDIKGELKLTEEKVLKFTPDQPLPNGQTYEAKLNLGALMNVPERYHFFRWKFKIVELNASFSPGHFIIPENSDSLIYEASFQTSDRTDSEPLKKAVKIEWDGSPLSTEWHQTGNIHTLRISPIIKTDSAQKLTLHFQRSFIDQEDFEIPVPGKDQLTVLSVRLNGNDRNSLQIDMSDNIDPEQDLNGLITLKNISGIKYKTEKNKIYLYYTTPFSDESLEVTLHKGLRDINGFSLNKDVTYTISLPSEMPAVKFIGEGNIIPADGKILIPFSAVSLKAVDVQIIKVFQQNMNFFLQENSYDDAGELMRTARPVFRKKIELASPDSRTDLTKWNDFTLNLSNLVQLEKGVIYRLEIRFKKSYTTLPCANEGEEEEDFYNQKWDGESSYYDSYYYSPDYQWKDRNDPCTPSYYTSQRFISKNIINTSLGIIAKRGVDNQYFVAVNDIITAAPVEDCTVSFYDFQNQKIDSVRTDKNGFAYLHTPAKAFILQARKGNDKAWLKVSDATALSLSNFDVSGQNVQSGLKGFLYGERGVWRPGDELYLSFILEDKEHVLPEGHPIVAELIDPKGNIIQTLTSKTGDIPIHTFQFRTAADAPTGYWKALVNVGGTQFTKTIRIETVKPNRFRIDMEFPNDKIIGQGVSQSDIQVKTRWLNGALAPNRKAVTEVRLDRSNYHFPDYPGYSFQDLTDNFESYSKTLFDGTTDAQGNFSFNLNGIKTTNAPGVLKAYFTTRLFDEGADFSISTYTTFYSPYTQYAGIKLPASEDGWYSTSAPVKLEGVVVNPLGKKVTQPTEISIEVYELSWSWWWDSNENSAASYIHRSSSNYVWGETVRSENGTFSLPIPVKKFGRYYILAKNKKSGQTSGLIAYFGSWGENASKEAATMLNISSDKQTYKTGEKVRIKIPSSKGSVAIVSLENGYSFRDIHRLETTSGSTYFEFEATASMCPNIYVSVSLIQPQKERDNDRPIRLYGVMNINVDDQQLHLEPEISMKQELRPGEDFTVTVSEKQQQAMDYTIAIVDEGLLSLTSFRTPAPFPAFYAREALGVKTWDFYNFIFGAYGSRLEKAFAVGGDEFLQTSREETTNRFKPVVLFGGPFSLQKGEKQTLTFRMPQYIGQVRAMVVAATNDGKYGSASSTALVKKPLMLSVAMPRLFSPGDVIEIPVTVFAMNDRIREVKVNLRTDDKIEVMGTNTQNTLFAKQGQNIVWFKIKIKHTTGISALSFSATSSGEEASVEEKVEIRLANPPITQVKAENLEAGKTYTSASTLSGANPSSTLEVTSIPPLNLAERLEELLAYPHGCSEQIISAAFPQISLDVLTPLSGQQKEKVETHVKYVIHRLAAFQTGDGGFATWPGSVYTSPWVSSYAAHFLLTARKYGYDVPEQLLKRDLRYLKTTANNYQIDSYYGETVQAYRLYVLALAGGPDLAAMNRMKERKLQNNTAQWLLASAYAVCNYNQVALNLIRHASQEIAPYWETGNTLGSSVRDKAIILESMVRLDLQQDAFRMLQQIAAALSSGEWMSTQTTAFALLSVTDYVKRYVGEIGGINIEITTGGKMESVETDKTVYQQILPLKDEKSQVTVKNKGKGNLYVRVINQWIPYGIIKEQVASGLSMSIKYYNAQNQPISIHQLPQGTDVIAEISIKNTGLTGGYQNLALSYLLPSGFEIINDRLTGNTDAFKEADYTDIRDDRYYVYFDLKQNQTKVFRFHFNAAYPGTYIRPAIVCNAMYNNNIEAILPGGETTIEK